MGAVVPGTRFVCPDYPLRPSRVETDGGAGVWLTEFGRPRTRFQRQLDWRESLNL